MTPHPIALDLALAVALDPPGRSLADLELAAREIQRDGDGSTLGALWLVERRIGWALASRATPPHEVLQ